MAFPNSHISYGSEFRLVDTLRPLLHKSPFRTSVQSSLDNGAKYPLSRISTKRRLKDLDEAIKHGNHKSAKSFPSKVSELVQKEVSHGFQLPISVASLHNIPHAIVTPYSLVHQFTVDEKGK